MMKTLYFIMKLNLQMLQVEIVFHFQINKLIQLKLNGCEGNK